MEAHPPDAPLEDLTLTVEDVRVESGRQLGLLEEAKDRKRKGFIYFLIDRAQ